MVTWKRTACLNFCGETAFRVGWIPVFWLKPFKKMTRNLFKLLLCFLPWYHVPKNRKKRILGMCSWKWLKLDSAHLKVPPPHLWHNNENTHKMWNCLGGFWEKSKIPPMSYEHSLLKRCTILVIVSPLSLGRDRARELIKNCINSPKPHVWGTE